MSEWRLAGLWVLVIFWTEFENLTLGLGGWALLKRKAAEQRFRTRCYIDADELRKNGAYERANALDCDGVASPAEFLWASWVYGLAFAAGLGIMVWGLYIR